MEGLSILEVIQKYDQVSQRDISKKTGLSLGMVNMLIKKFLKVGLLKAEKLNGNSIKYILTTTGSQVLIEKTVNYVKRSFDAVGKISGHVEEIINKEFKDEPILFVLGDYGEVFEVIASVAKKSNKQVCKIDSVENINSKVMYINKPSDNDGIGVFEGLCLDD